MCDYCFSTIPCPCDCTGDDACKRCGHVFFDDDNDEEEF